MFLLYISLSLTLKTISVGFVKAFVNFLQAYRGFHLERDHEDLYDSKCFVFGVYIMFAGQ